MARKSSDTSGALILIVLVVGAVGAAVKWAQENLMAIGVLVAAVILIAVGVATARNAARKSRVASLLSKYGDQEVVDLIMRRSFWEGQSEEQLLDSLGPPHAVDKQLLKTKRKEIWKYHEVRKNQFQLRITVENGNVVGWDKKAS